MLLRSLTKHMPTEFSTDAEFLTVRQVAFFLNISLRSVQRILQSKDLPMYKFRGSTRISRDDLKQYVQKLRRVPVGD